MTGHRLTHSYDHDGHAGPFRRRSRRPLWIAGAVCALAVSTAAAQPAAPSIRITGVEVLSDELIRVTYVSADERTSLEIPAGILKEIVTRIQPGDAIAATESPPPSAPPAAGTRGPRKVGAARAQSRITGEVFHATIVADSIVTLRFVRDGEQRAVSLPPDLFPLLEAHHRALTGRLRDTEAQFWLDQSTGTIHFGFMRGFDYRWVLAALALLLGLSVALITRLAVARVRRERDELLASRRHMAKVREDERSHLASELHDGPIQDLQRILRTYVGELSELTADEQRAKLAEIEFDLRDVAGSLRNICSDLKPPVLVHFGLARAIEAFARDFMARNAGIEIDFEAGPDADHLAMESRLVLYRIVQEALTNVEKHASADRVEIRLSRQGSSIRLSIADTGRGFRVPSRLTKLEHSGHFGLTGMLHRAQAVGGSLEVSSRNGGGTVIDVTIPYRPSEEEIHAGRLGV